MPVSFPSNLPAPSGWMQSYRDDVVRTEMDAGVTKTRRRYTRVRRQVDVTWRFTREVQGDFVEWFEDVTQLGSLSFTLRSPLDAALRTWRFREQPRFSPSDPSIAAVEVTAKIEEV